MNAERINELAALGAAGALEGDEAREFQALLAAADPAAQTAVGPMLFPEFSDLKHSKPDPATLTTVGRLRDAAALAALARATPRTPPAALKARVLAAVQKPAPRKGFYFIGQHEGKWIEPLPGVRVKELSVDRAAGRATLLIDLAPGTRYPIHHHHGGEECFVVSGDFHVEGRVLGAGDFHHAEGETDHGESFTENGCRLLIVADAADYLPAS